MAVWSIVSTPSLDSGLILAPERYHPRRDSIARDAGGRRIVDVATHAKDVLSLGGIARGAHRLRVLDTTHAVEGRVSGGAAVRSRQSLGSSKKLLLPGDVIVSRLRPYLRQVAYLDEALFLDADSSACGVACSTEFFVLRSADSASIAFLVPFLLTDVVQGVFASSVEGGHHPRFSAEVLLGLPLPQSVLDARQEVSAAVIQAIHESRSGETRMNAETSKLGQLLSPQLV